MLQLSWDLSLHITHRYIIVQGLSLTQLAKTQLCMYKIAVLTLYEHFILKCVKDNVKYDPQYIEKKIYFGIFLYTLHTKTINTYVFWEYYPKTHTSVRNFTGTAQILDYLRRKSRKLSLFYWFLIYYRKHFENIRRGVYETLKTVYRSSLFQLTSIWKLYAYQQTLLWKSSVFPFRCLSAKKNYFKNQVSFQWYFGLYVFKLPWLT